MRYEVDTAALRDGAASVEDALAQVQRLAVTDELRGIVAAVPGGRTAAGLAQLAAAWEARLAGTRWELKELGRSLARAADAYDAVERSARQAMSGSAERPA